LKAVPPEELRFLGRDFSDDTLVPSVGLVHLKGLTNLQRLHLNKTDVTDAGLAHLAKLKVLVLLFVTKLLDERLENLLGWFK